MAFGFQSKSDLVAVLNTSHSRKNKLLLSKVKMRLLLSSSSQLCLAHKGKGENNFKLSQSYLLPVTFQVLLCTSMTKRQAKAIFQATRLTSSAFLIKEYNLNNLIFMQNRSHQQTQCSLSIPAAVVHLTILTHHYDQELERIHRNSESRR